MTQRDPFHGAWRIFLAVAMVLLAVHFLLRAAPVRAENEEPHEPMVHIDCQKYADFASWVATLRMVDARIELVIDYVRGHSPAPHGLMAQALVREARLVYTEGAALGEARFQAWLCCEAVFGKFGPDA